MRVIQARYSEDTYLLSPVRFSPNDIVKTSSHIFPLEPANNIGIAIYIGHYSKKPKIFGHRATIDSYWTKVEMKPETIKVLYGKAR